ncbi:WD40 repeat-like protein [Venustampulla echinocandica]|uniref:WD40 repeat-like protein n=1 Tax=Venustampulla echinocandica TaxID=2656787 RepID=A0A370TRR3_9HELO|nr:WD40 repeat-like protein [Venustampulla echinocandica]RDL38225.1 WD40 repeat-like protein [Venustampulla echinocandica]
MSGCSSGCGDGNGLDSLFAQLRQQQNKPINLEPSYSYYNNNSNGFGQQPTPPQQPHGYHQPSVSSPIPTPPAHHPQPVHSSAIMSPVETPQSRIPAAAGGPSNADRTSSLLNLLKFSQPSLGSATQPVPIGTPLPHSREPSINFGGPDVQGQVGSPGHGRGGSDLLAALMGAQSKPAQEPVPEFAINTQPAPSSFGAAPTSPSADTQAYLLQLLNQPKPSQTDNTQLKPAKILTPPSQTNSQDGVAELAQALEEASHHMSSKGAAAPDAMHAFRKEPAKETVPYASQGLFTYVNPFDQLAASSPRNRTPKASTPAQASSNAPAPAIQILKHPRHDVPDKGKKNERNTMSNSAYVKRKHEPVSQQSSAPPTPLPDGRTPVEALMGIGASGGKTTVSDALNEIGGQVEKQAQEAIARVERHGSHTSIEQDLRDMLAARTEAEFKETAEVAARDIKRELEKDENSGALDSLPVAVADTVKDIIDDAAQGHIADSWESIDAEDSPAKSGEGNDVKVYNFPMKPWIAITIKDTDEPRPSFREEAVMDIARLKKEFDQIDRTLVTASGNFIVYGMSKNGGVRIIRQDDGKDARLFTETRDRIFSVTLASSPADLREAIIGTGISGTVYWAVIKDGEGDHLEDSMPEMHGFALPPIQSHDTESPGGVLKTRARKSSTHPDFFAVGRGKFIHVIWPSVILKQSYLKHGKDRLVDTDKYLKQLSLKINTGKAGKDFTFSEDDTTIVSLDKSGRVKFWDVRSLTNPEVIRNGSHSEHIEIKEPLITYTTTPASEKSWPTSVLFVDKLRPYQKGGPLRYLIVGMKQNHTLQLWDLALGKPVQEIHLPHSKESDAVCSVVYHAATGMIVVGHPTRNSIYFLHLSAPKYNLPKSITQAGYMEKIVTNNSSVLKPDSTAVISGMREYSFADKGTLRSLDILQTSTLTPTEDEAPTMFELYAMHSKGVTCLLIKQQDLGWTLDNKVVGPVEAEKAGVISIDNLKEISPAPAPEINEPSTALPATPSQVVPRPAAKETASKETSKKSTPQETPNAAAKVEEKKELVATGGGEKKKRRKATASSEAVTAGSSSQSKTVVLDPSSHSRSGNASKASATATTSSRGPSQDISDGALKSIENRLASEVKKHFGESLDSLYQDIKDDRRTQAAVADAKQDAMLRLVSSTLSDNIEATLGRIVATSIQKSVLPAISDVALKAVKDQLGSKINLHLAQNLPKELQKALPDAVGKALQQPQLLKLMSESLANSVAFRVEEQFASLMQSVITPTFTNLAIQTSQKVAGDIQRQAADQIDTIERQRHADGIKIEQLTQLVTGLTETVSSMAAAQSEFQKRLLRQQSQSGESQYTTAHRTEGSTVSIMSPPNVPAAPVQPTAAEEEYDSMLASIKKSMSERNYENAAVQWLQTRREQEFFANYFSKLHHDIIRDFLWGLSPLLLLSLGATITVAFEDLNYHERVDWMEMLMFAFESRANAGELDDQVRSLIPRIIAVYIQRLEHAHALVNGLSKYDTNVPRLYKMITSAKHILELGSQPR